MIAMEQPVINIGIMGVGNIGTGVARILLQERELLASRCGMRFNLKTVVDTDWERERGVGFAGVKMGTDVTEIINDPEIDIVIETIGGYEPAFTYVMQALASGKHVITANKALLATKGRELFSHARANGVDILFEASGRGSVIMGYVRVWSPTDPRHTGSSTDLQPHPFPDYLDNLDLPGRSRKHRTEDLPKPIKLWISMGLMLRINWRSWLL